MKWKQKPASKVGDTRVISVFLFLPKKLNGELRWFESAFIEQKLIAVRKRYPNDGPFQPEIWDTFHEWIDERWATESEYATRQVAAAKRGVRA
jgi:hypothetical protein